MHQETTTINSDELFGSFFDLDEFQDCKDGFEKYWEWPEEVGNGFMRVINLRPGLILGIGDYRLLENIEINFELEHSPITLGFSVSGNVKHTVNYEEGQKDLWEYKQGHSVMTYLPECQGINRHTAGTPVGCVGLFIDPLLFNTFMEGQHDRIPTVMLDILNGTDDKLFYQTSTMTPFVNVIIHQILNCPYQFTLKRLYLEGKALELISYSMAQFVSPGATLQKASVLRPDDIERVQEARNVLIRNLENPPSLLELDRQVGTNKTTLNQGFRQIFGTSAFNYLRMRRLERARDLLESKKMNVTEAAFEVGYSQQSNFTKAFKNHFGTNPTDHLL